MSEEATSAQAVFSCGVAQDGMTDFVFFEAPGDGR